MLGIGLSGRFGGIGGSRTPMPLRLRGGPPPCAEEACGSSSNSFSEKSYGTEENATPSLNNCLEQAKYRFDRNPERYRSTCRVLCRNEFPSSNRLSCPFFKSHPYALYYANLQRSAVRSHQYL